MDLDGRGWLGWSREVRAERTAILAAVKGMVEVVAEVMVAVVEIVGMGWVEEGAVKRTVAGDDEGGGNNRDVRGVVEID